MYMSSVILHITSLDHYLHSTKSRSPYLHTGKTIEVMTLMVSNTRTDISTGESSSLLGDTTKPGGLKTIKQKSTKAIRDLYVTRATLIVVPSTLVGQWSRELQSRIVYSELPSKKFDVLNVSNRYLKEVLTIPAEDLVSSSDHIEVGQSVQFTIPWGPPTKVLYVRVYVCLSVHLTGHYKRTC